MLQITIRTILVLPFFQTLASQPSPPSATRRAVDSSTIVRAARSAQSSFESFRRNRLPVGYRSSSGICDVHIGRYCYWRGDEDDDQPPPPEEPHIGERRKSLITTLDAASQALRGDAWIAGQLVRYLVEAERYDEAIGFASTDCKAADSWCNALAGYAAHTGARFAVADSAYSRALAAMDSTERCKWLDISDLLDADLEHRFTSLPCSAREPFVRRLFWLGAPLYSVSGTDLLTEHLARVTRAKIAERSASIDGQAWADDVRALVVRYGWSRWYSRTPPAFGSQAEPSYTGHDEGMPYNYFPRIHAVDHLGHLDATDWTLDEPRAPTGYSPAYARSMHDLPHQIATFRRGDSTVIVAAWDARRDTTLIGRPLDAALVLAGDGAQRAIVKRTDAATTGHLSAIAVIDSGIASLELLTPKERRAARARVGIPMREEGTLSLSSLLLYTPGTSTPATLDAVQDSALTSEIIGGSRAVGVYWEAYGVPPAIDAARFALSVEQISVGWMQRAAAQLHLTDPSAALSVSWSEVPQQVNGIAGRGVRVDLGQLRSGKYRMTLTMTIAGQPPVIATKEIELR